MTGTVHGLIVHNDSLRIDSLYRVSLKALIYNPKKHILVVKEAGEKYWDLPGGGMDHGEDILSCLARELHEEVSFKGDIIDSQVIGVDSPVFLQGHSLWQLRVIFLIETDQTRFYPGKDCDEVMFIDPSALSNSTNEDEMSIIHYHKVARRGN